MTFLFLLGFSLLFVAESVCNAQDVLPYEDPGYSALGCYAGDKPEMFDYTLRQIRLSDSFPHKKEWWQSFEKRISASSRADIYLLYLGKRTDSVETLKNRIDLWLAPEPGIKTYPEKIPAVCFWEENTTGLIPVLEQLATYVRTKYRIPVFQWFSDPLEPSPALTADGWIWDSYSWTATNFRRHVMKFSCLKKPSHCIIWATDPNWPDWEIYGTTEKMINQQWLQFGICREFNTAVSVFAVSGPHGSVNTWMVNSTPEMVLLRSQIAMKRREIHSIPRGTLPQPEANFSCRERTVSVGGTQNRPSEYRENFDGFRWIHDASIDGFTQLHLTSKPQEPGFLSFIPDKKHSGSASLVYRCESYFPLESMSVSVVGEAVGSRITLSLSLDESASNWPVERTWTNTNKLETLELSDKELVRGKHVCYVRVQMADRTNNPEQNLSQPFVCRLDSLRIHAVHLLPEKTEPIRLKRDVYDSFQYQDDFMTERYLAFGKLEVSQPTYGGWKPGKIWVGSHGGYAGITKLQQSVAIDQPMESLAVSVRGTSSASLGGSIEMTLKDSQGKVLVQEHSSGKFRGPLALNVPSDVLKEPSTFILEIILKSGSGVELKDKVVASIDHLSFKGVKRK